MEHNTTPRKNLILMLIILVSISLGFLLGFSLRASPISISNINTNTNGVSNKVNVNTASKSELEALGGIGEVKAKKIIEHRPYKSIYDLKSFIGDTVFYKIKDNLEV